MTVEFTDKELDVISKSIMPVGATKEDFNYFIAQAKRTGLDPLKRQIWATMRNQKDGTRKIIVGISIDGFRSLAERTGKYGGRLGPFFYDQDGKEYDVWLWDKPPAAVKVGIIRTDWAQPLWQVGRPNSFAPDSPPFGSPWLKMKEWMTAKCLECGGLRGAFPDVFGGLYGEEELGLEPKQVEEGESFTLQEPAQEQAPASKSVPAESGGARGRKAKVVEGVEPEPAKQRQAESSARPEQPKQVQDPEPAAKETSGAITEAIDVALGIVDVEPVTEPAAEPGITPEDIMGVLYVGQSNGYSEEEISDFPGKTWGYTEETILDITRTQLAQWKHAFSKRRVAA